MPTPGFVTDERDFNLTLLKALGLDHLPVQKVVLVVEEGCLPQVYVRCLTPSTIPAALAEGLAHTRVRRVEDVSVSDTGEVSVVEDQPVKVRAFHE